MNRSAKWVGRGECTTFMATGMDGKARIMRRNESIASTFCCVLFFLATKPQKKVVLEPSKKNDHDTDVEKQDYDRIAQKIDNWVERVPGSTTLHKIEMMRFVELWYKDVDKSSREFDAWCDYCLKSINEHHDTDCFWK
jgi:hypothetical protein